MNTYSPDLLRSFENRDLDPKSFGHKDHVRVAYDMLKKYDFMEATVKYAENINAIATKAGAPGKFNLTITLAFLSVIAERIEVQPSTGYEEFIAGNSDLLSSHLLAGRYSPDRLQSDLARSVFLLPDQPG